MSALIASPQEVLDFWFSAGPQKWFSKDDAFDAAIRERFLRDAVQPPDFLAGQLLGEGHR